MEVNLQGHTNRRTRAVSIWKQMLADYTDPVNPLTIKQIAAKYKKTNGKPYSDRYIYWAFNQLKKI